MTDGRVFGSAAEEARHWKAQVEDMRAALREAETGLQEFMESSKELEAEMEADMAATSQRADALQVENEHLRADVDEWRTKYQKSVSEHTTTLADLQRELTKLRETHDVYKARLRDMEVDNDTLENAERMINSSLKDMEARYNQAIERTSLLETELEDKSRLETENQRLKDELRELKEEVAMLERAQVKPPSSDNEELTLSDLVVVRPQPAVDTISERPPLERLREHMQQLQQRLQRAQTAGITTNLQRHWQRSSIPRPRSSMSSSTGGAPASPAAWRAPTPSRPETPHERRHAGGSSIPVPVGGLSRSQSRSRPPSRAVHEAQPSPVGPVPFEFMEHDPALSPVSMRQSLSRRRSLGGLSGIPTPSHRTPRPTSAMRSPSKMPRPVSPTKRPAVPSPSPWR